MAIIRKLSTLIHNLLVTCSVWKISSGERSWQMGIALPWRGARAGGWSWWWTGGRKGSRSSLPPKMFPLIIACCLKRIRLKERTYFCRRIRSVSRFSNWLLSRLHFPSLTHSIEKELSTCLLLRILRATSVERQIVSVFIFETKLEVFEQVQLIHHFESNHILI